MVAKAVSPWFHPKKRGIAGLPLVARGHYICDVQQWFRVPATLPHTTRNMSKRSLGSRLWYESLRRGLQLAGVLVFRVRHTGYHNVPRSGAVLLVCNHQSVIDPPMVGVGCPRHMNYLARETLFSFGPFGWLLSSVNAIPIDRRGQRVSGLKTALKRLKQGEMVLVFPEGTRSDDGRIRPFRPGFCTLAQRSGAAILPAAIEGAFQVWPRGRKFPRPGPIHVHFGRPLWPCEVAAWDEQRLAAEVERRVRRCHARLRSHPAFAGGKELSRSRCSNPETGEPESG